MNYKLRAFDGKVVWDVRDYVVKENDVELITTKAGKTLSLNETEYLIVLGAEKESLLNIYLLEDKSKENYIKVVKDDYSRLIKFYGNGFGTGAISTISTVEDVSEDVGSESMTEIQETVSRKARRRKTEIEQQE